MNNRIQSLDNFVNEIHIMKKAIPVDLSIAICDLEKFIAYFPGNNINLGIKKGQFLNKDEPLAEALRTKKNLQAEVPANFYGFAFIGTAMPLFNNSGDVIGGIAVQVRKQTELIDIAFNIDKNLDQANHQIKTISEGATQLTTTATMLQQQSQLAEQGTQKTTEIVTLLKRMADHTNLLGLNAAIEAARVGEMGKGFEVVAKEIRRFSSDTLQSTQQINKTMLEIHRVTTDMLLIIENLSQIGHSQFNAIENMADFIEQIKKMSEQLNIYAKSI